MKKDIFVLVLVIIAFVAYALLFGNFNKLGISSTENIMKKVSVIPISHATAVFEWEGNTIYVDPTGGKKSFANSKSPDIILVTDIHGDHLNKETLEAVMGEETVLIAPKADVDLLAETLAKKKTILNSSNSYVQSSRRRRQFSHQGQGEWICCRTRWNTHICGRRHGRYSRNACP